MVSTRSGANTDNVMENPANTMAEVGATSSRPIYTMPPGTTVTDTSIAPAARRFMSFAQDRSERATSSRAASDSITPPEYSAITIQNEGQEPHQSFTRAPTSEPFDEQNAGAEVVSGIRSDFSRRIQELQDQMQAEIGRAMERWSLGPRNPPEHIPTTGVHNREGLHPNHLSGCVQPPLPVNTLPANTQLAYERLPTPCYGHPAARPPLGNAPLTNPLRPYNPPVAQANIPRPQPPNAVLHTPPRFRGFHPSPLQSSPALDLGYPHQQKTDLSKWGIKFDGSSKAMSAEDFIFRVETLRQDFNYSLHDIRRSFHVLLEGQALDWYWNLRQLSPILTWDDLKSAFLTQYRRYESEFQIQKRMMDRRQMSQESFEDFFNAVMRLRNQQRVPYLERDLIEIMKSNLKPSLAQLLFSVNVVGLQDFCQQAKRAENLLLNQRQQFQPRPMAAQRVQELSYVEEPTEAELGIDALTTASRYVCWNCKQTGHGFMDCPSPTRRVFCFKCGRDNVVTPKCPRCQGNPPQNRPRTGETRSTQT